jgi:hypothetical protein
MSSSADDDNRCGYLCAQLKFKFGAQLAAIRTAAAVVNRRTRQGSGHLIQSVALDYHERADSKEKLLSIISCPQTTMSILNIKRPPNLNIQKGSLSARRRRRLS